MSAELECIQAKKSREVVVVRLLLHGLPMRVRAALMQVAKLGYIATSKRMQCCVL